MPLAKSTVKFQMFSVESIPIVQQAVAASALSPSGGTPNLVGVSQSKKQQQNSPSITSPNANRPLSNTQSPVVSSNTAGSKTYSLMEQMSKKIQQNIPSVLTNIGKHQQQ
ncbi:hypothetical protein PPL_04301 [Heterostelium album PN500]|uniref:Uncharacterized protein n=1 Tax=Heterostelium pallidum (strain ATCC 26659 / Pp 5 / PN500) TaxID=670386 RepID=D3B766_HETP5|nr:hypothetical protein PPL_04301 [Heterostelium album PN500]EFA82609.1 hypothetical protein PPL_04301 [Heterostelium album PN500]|eukprot:XP_020434726.1 hypothetical protein PPL_04301 [Heterostelium album PN500]